MVKKATTKKSKAPVNKYNQKCPKCGGVLIYGEPEISGGDFCQGYWSCEDCEYFKNDNSSKRSDID